MGREIRREPKDWAHPTYNSRHYFSNMDPFDYKDGRYYPLYDEEYDKASEKWIENFLLRQKRSTQSNQQATAELINIIGNILAIRQKKNIIAMRSMKLNSMDQ